MLRYVKRQVKMTTLESVPIKLIRDPVMNAKSLNETVLADPTKLDFASWVAMKPKFPGPEGTVDGDLLELQKFCGFGQKILERGVASREEVELNLYDARSRFLRIYAEVLYSLLTNDFSNSVRLETLVELAMERFRGLLPLPADLEEDSNRILKDKRGHEKGIGLFLSHLFASPRAGVHLLQSMLKPLPESLELTAKFGRDDFLDLGAAILRRKGKSTEVAMYNPDYLNAEDAGTVGPMEQAVDVAILDANTEVCVLRGSLAKHPRYVGKSIFCSGINLTHLYEGKIPYLWYLVRDLGFVNKIAHGVLEDEEAANDPTPTTEKPWIAAVETFAIGGGCQYLLVMDYTLAEKSAYLTLPARKEGIIPGLANMRLPRFVGDRITRQAILFDRRLEADSPEGRLIVDETVPDGEMDKAVEQTVNKLTSAGTVSAAGNRKALRVCQESLDDVRRYLASYAYEQVKCHLSPALVYNLEENWLKPKGKI